MEYFSTRDTELRVPSAKAIAQGLSRDGGLFAPMSIPKLTDEEIENLCQMNYPQRAAFVLGKFLTDFTSEELQEYASKAYSEDKFKASSAAPAFHCS